MLVSRAKRMRRYLKVLSILGAPDPALAASGVPEALRHLWAYNDHRFVDLEAAALAQHNPGWSGNQRWTARAMLGQWTPWRSCHYEPSRNNCHGTFGAGAYCVGKERCRQVRETRRNGPKKHRSPVGRPEEEPATIDLDTVRAELSGEMREMEDLMDKMIERASKRR